jgi:hypothetical protein
VDSRQWIVDCGVLCGDGWIVVSGGGVAFGGGVDGWCCSVLSLWWACPFSQWNWDQGTADDGLTAGADGVALC